MVGDQTLRWDEYPLHRCTSQLWFSVYFDEKKQTGKREKPYNHWEPIYIGTNDVKLDQNC